MLSREKGSFKEALPDDEEVERAFREGAPRAVEEALKALPDVFLMAEERTRWGLGSARLGFSRIQRGLRAEVATWLAKKKFDFWVLDGIEGKRERLLASKAMLKTMKENLK